MLTAPLLDAPLVAPSPTVPVLAPPVPTSVPEVVVVVPLPAAGAPVVLPAAAATEPLPGELETPLRLLPELAGLPEVVVGVPVDACDMSPVEVADGVELQRTWLPANRAAHTNPQKVWPLDIARSLFPWVVGEGVAIRWCIFAAK